MNNLKSEDLFLFFSYNSIYTHQQKFVVVVLNDQQHVITCLQTPHTEPFIDIFFNYRSIFEDIAGI